MIHAILAGLPALEAPLTAALPNGDWGKRGASQRRRQGALSLPSLSEAVCKASLAQQHDIPRKFHPFMHSDSHTRASEWGAERLRFLSASGSDRFLKQELNLAAANRFDLAEVEAVSSVGIGHRQRVAVHKGVHIAVVDTSAAAQHRFPILRGAVAPVR